MAEVGRSYNIVVTAGMLAAEAARVEASSRDPATLARIRAVFGDDEEAYRRLVLRPILMNQLLHARFSRGHDIQREPLGRAKKVLAAAMTRPAELAGLATEYGGTYQRMTIKRDPFEHNGDAAADVPAPLAPFGVDWSEYGRTFWDKVVREMAVGQLHPRVVEDRRRFMVVRLLSRNAEGGVLERVVIKKLSFESWFQMQTRHLAVKINDRGLPERLAREVDVPQLARWLSRNGGRVHDMRNSLSSRDKCPI